MIDANRLQMCSSAEHKRLAIDAMAMALKVTDEVLNVRDPVFFYQVMPRMRQMVRTAIELYEEYCRD